MSMAVEAPAPIEWVWGNSRARWLVGFWLVFVAVYLAANQSLLWGLSWAGLDASSPRANLVLGLASIGIASGPALVWGLLVPMPVERLGLSPEGVVIDHGLRSDRWPWSRVSLRGSVLELRSLRFGGVARYSLTPDQSRRVAHLQPGLTTTDFLATRAPRPG